jgi:hypothetical protein
MKIEHKMFESEVKTFDDENLIVEHFISTEHKDRGGDIMRAKGMRIVGKPVVLLLHGRGPMGGEPVAKPLSIAIDEFKGQPGILAKTQFFPDEVGIRLYQKIKGGWIPNWSIGYSVDEAKDLMREGRYDGRDVTKWQLYEYSPVGVPMNPFAQTIKEFLDKNEDPKGPFEVPESHWFGVVEEKSCTGCGACANAGLCKTCKGPITYFANGQDYLGKACEKCEPEEFDKLKLGIAPLPKCAACSDTKVVKTVLDGKEYEDPCPVCTAKAPDPMEARMAKMETMMTSMDARCKKMEDAMGAMADAMKSLGDSFAKLEPLLKTLPPEPEGGKEGDEEHHDNPPEKKTPPRLVIVREEDTPEAMRAAQIAQILAIAREAVSEAARQEIDRLRGRVP